MLTDYLNSKKIKLLPNTAGCYSSEEALRTLRLAREMGGWKLVKLEVLGDKKTLYPNMIETIKSTRTLVREGFKVMVYCTDDPLLAKKLEDCGASAINAFSFTHWFRFRITKQSKYFINSKTNKGSSYY